MVSTKFVWPSLQKEKENLVGQGFITFLVTDDLELYLVYIYDKNQLDNLTKDQIIEMLKKAGII